MKKTFALSLAALLCVSLLAGCGGTAEAPAEEAEETTEAAETTDAAEATGDYVFLDETLGVESYAIGFRVGDQELADTVSGAVQALVLNGTYD